MANWNHPALRMLRKMDHKLANARMRYSPRKYWGKNQKLEVRLFDGYGNQSAIRISGRVLRYKKPSQHKRVSGLRQFRDTYNLFNSREIFGATVNLQIGEYSTQLVTDREGYFHLKKDWEEPYFTAEQSTAIVLAEIIDAPVGDYHQVRASAPCYLTSSKAQYGLITDIDDTVLKTDITSRFKWRAVYATFFQDVEERQSIPGSADFISAEATNGPAFYVSNSPWNIYPFLQAFLKRNQFPAAPILLRDIGIPIDIEDRRPHKIKTISEILEFHPNLPFILIGDSGQKDANYYQEIDRLYPGRIKHKLIRKIPGTVLKESMEGIYYFDDYKELLETFTF